VSQTELKSLDDVRRHNQEQEARRAKDDRARRWALVAKRITWMILISGAFLAYYLLDKMQEAVSLLK
jgi:hypothetical protein